MKCGFIAIIGMSNAGKSTLINNLIGEKVSIVSHKINTTRNKILGIKCIDNTQMIFMDTPGIIFNPKCLLQKKMSENYKQSTIESDINLLVIDTQLPIKKNADIIKQLSQYKSQLFIVFNKIDLIKNKYDLLPMLEYCKTLATIDDYFLISAKNNDGIEKIESIILKNLPNRDWIFDDKTVSDTSNKFIASEITREKVFKYLHDEIPYSTHIETEHLYDKNNCPDWMQNKVKNAIAIYQNIFVETMGQKKLIIGQRGHKIKLIGEESRKEISQILNIKVHLFLHVKILKHWKEKIVL